MLGPDRTAAPAFLRDVEGLFQRLETRVVINLPGARLGQSRRPLTARQRAERLLDSAILCLLDSLQGADKAVETVTGWLEQFGVLPAHPRRGGSTTAFVKKRAQRARARVKGPGALWPNSSAPLTPTGYVADLLTGSYAQLKQYLLLSAGMRDGSLWAEQGRRWGMTASAIQRACEAFGRDRSFRPDDPAGFEVFQEALGALERQGGGPAVKAFVAAWARRAQPSSSGPIAAN
jgi:hypothetical protein